MHLCRKASIGYLWAAEHSSLTGPAFSSFQRPFWRALMKFLGGLFGLWTGTDLKKTEAKVALKDVCLSILKQTEDWALKNLWTWTKPACLGISRIHPERFFASEMVSYLHVKKHVVVNFLVKLLGLWRNLRSSGVLLQILSGTELVTAITVGLNVVAKRKNRSALTGSGLDSTKKSV